MHRIFLVGFMGSGKTAMGKLLAKQLGLTFVDLDSFIENRYRRSVAQIFEQKGENVFREIERKCLLEVSEYENVVVATGGGAPCYFNNMDLMNKKGITLYLKLTIDQLYQRLLASKTGLRPLITNKSPDELKFFISVNLGARESFYNQAKYTITGTDAEIMHQIYTFKPSDLCD